MYFLEQKVPIICLQPFLETIRFVIFRTDINFSKGNHMFLESECLRGEQVAVHSDSYINKKVISFFFFSSETLSGVSFGKEQSFLSVTASCFHPMIFIVNYCV